ncbi:MAG TPA: hypothetical protein HPP77_00595 [Candidatus Hydrogenedentes bacterium]|nr:hypothetical protein [Candidatus Hydrogenedentota bacterium]
MNWEETGIKQDALERYVEDQVYSLPGIECHRDAFTVLLTGSRATGFHNPRSDVDIDVLCPQHMYEAVHRSAMEAGIISTPKSFFVVAPDKGWEQYFGAEIGRPHFSLTCLDHVASHFRAYSDVWIWVWTHAKAVRDPGGQFQRMVDAYKGYPKDVLVGKIKYRWLLAGYWAVELFPYHHSRADADLLPASAAILNAVNEFLRVFSLVEGKPFPYTEKLLHHAQSTELGREFLPMLQNAVDLVVGNAAPHTQVWDRLDAAAAALIDGDNEAVARFEAVCGEKMVQAGVEPRWVKDDFRNIDELLLGELGPIPQIG